MADDAELGYTLSEDAMRRVAATVIRDERRLRNGPSRRRRNTSPGTFHSALAKTTSTITARSGTTPGSGTATVWERDSSVVAAVEFTDLVDMTIYNASTSAVSSGSYVLIHRDREGQWWVKDGGAAPETGGCTAVFSDLTYTIASGTYILADLASPGNLGGLVFTLDAGGQAITVPSAGLYIVHLSAAAQGTQSCIMQWEIYKNLAANPTSTSLGTEIGIGTMAYNTSRALVQNCACTGLAQFDTGEHICVRLSHTSGSSNDWTFNDAQIRVVRIKD